MENMLKKIEQAGLAGRGGGCFPTAAKWRMVKDAPGDRKFVVCNAAEGEPDVSKDGHILEHHADVVVAGMFLAITLLKAEKGIIYLNSDYDKRFGKAIKAAIGDKSIEIFVKPHHAGYIGGEETSVINAIEGGRIEPRLRPPFPPTNGLWNCPTLVNNVETFYNVGLVLSNDYQGQRFYTINGDCLWTGVYELPANATINEILKETKNYPDFPFFVQVGGGASGEVLNSGQLDRPASGAGSITVYSLAKHKPMDLVKKWVDYFAKESCGQCTPCREGTYRLKEVLRDKQPDWQLFNDLLENISESAFCGLGCALPIPLKSLMHNVVHPQDNLPGRGGQTACECFK
jgi:[NiFe] hydrogenase diaphorase moiety large subunit